MPQLRFSTSLIATFAACLALGGCASELKKAESEVAELTELLPGRYNNAAQAEQEAKDGKPAHTALMLDIVRIDLPLLSDYVFYAQESAADDPQRITSQRLMTFEAVKDGRIVERVYTFVQPQRWRDAHLNLRLFGGLMHQDTTPLNGCDLDWKKDGDKFVGANNRETCRVNSAALGSVKVDMRVELSADELAMAELSYGGGGKLLQGDSAEPFYRFQRGNGP
jgi:hypothetical protein